MGGRVWVDDLLRSARKGYGKSLVLNLDLQVEHTFQYSPSQVFLHPLVREKNN